MKRTHALLIVSLTFALFIAPVPNVRGNADYVTFVNYFDSEKAWNTIGQLAGDQFEGRKAATHGAELASEYIANHFQSIGLKSAGTSGSYRTVFTMPLWQLKQTPSLAGVDPVGNTLQSFGYRTDYYVQQGSDSGEFSAQVVFAGYGISATGVGYDDYAEIAVSGKIVLAIAGTPPSDRLKDYSFWGSKADAAKNHGALGLILADSPREPTPHYIERWSGGWTIYSKLTTLRGTIGMADTLLKESGVTLSSVQRTIDQQLKPQPLSVNKLLRVSVAVSYREDASAYNVLGFIPGSDPAASRKVVIIGAHYDHLGKDADGSIFSGANDNGSGVAVMMEIARMFAGWVKPKWSVLFVAWSGEEEGYWGSYTYVYHPYFPLSGTVAYLNLDMVGAGAELTAFVSDVHKQLRETMSASAQELGISPDVEGYVTGSDHVPFEEKKVPNVMFIYEPLDDVYHTPADTPAHISKTKLLETGKLTGLVALKLAEASFAPTAATTAPVPVTMAIIMAVIRRSL